MKLMRKAFVAILLSTAVLPAIAPSARAEIVVTVGTPPPLLPLYDQPPLPDVGYLWMPGYWAYDDLDGYFWVPGTWVLPPRQGLLWTPGYWAFEEGAYLFRPGYWGEQVGYYGGVDYGFGYTGVGYRGGYWRGGNFFYNQAVTRITNVRVVNIFNETIIRSRDNIRVSFNGGPGGIRLRPTAEQLAFMRAPHVGLTPQQRRHVQLAHQNPSLRERENHGRPPLAATPRPFGPGGAGQGVGPGEGRPSGLPRPVIGVPVGPRGDGPRGEPRPEPRGGRPDLPRPEMRRPDVARPEPVRPDMRVRPGPEPVRPRPEDRRPREVGEPPRPAEMRPPERRPRPDEARPMPRQPDRPQRAREPGPHPGGPGPRPGAGPHPGGPGGHPGPHPGPHPREERR